MEPLQKMLKKPFFYQKRKIEDGVIQGGFGSSILEFAAQKNYKNKINILGIPDTFIEHGNVMELQKEIGLDVKNLEKIFSKT